MIDLAILNGTVVSGGRVFESDLGIAGDTIALLADPGQLPPAARAIDASGLLVLPGAIDIHFHCRAPAYPERGDFASETQAAAAGGVTTVFEMPISKPACSTPEVFRARRAVGEASAYVNFALFGAPGTLRREDVAGMADEGAIGFKIFMHAAPWGREDEFDGLALPNDRQIYEALLLVKEVGLRCTVHAESNDLLEHFTAAIQAAGRKDLGAHGAARPPIVESLAIARLGAMCRELQTPIHIAHLSSAMGLSTLLDIQGRGAPMSAETCVHYLLFDEQQAAQAGPYAKINPPIRTASDRAALWSGVLSGAIGAVASDHSPYRPAEKEVGWEDIWRAPSGSPGVEMLLPAVLDAALRGRIDLAKAVDLLTRGPAQLFGLYPRKGSISPGADADIALFDPDQHLRVDPTQWYTRGKDCDRLYRGLDLKGKLTTTIVNGQVVYDRGRVLQTARRGRFVRPGKMGARAGEMVAARSPGAQ